MKLLLRMFLAVALVLISNASCKEVSDTGGGTPLGIFEGAPCPLELPEGVEEGKDVRCGYVRVPEFHSQPNGRSFRIPVAVVTAVTDSPAPDPFVVAPSGPGDSALNIIADVTAPGAGVLRQTRDVVLIEFRGLPRSDPALICHEIPQAQREGMGRNLSGAEILEARLQAVIQCRKRLEEDDINLKAFNYTETAADLDLITTALGYERFNLYGTSAGTLLAQHMLRDYPHRLRSVIIDSAVPLGRGHNAMPGISGRILKQQFEACAEDPECSRAFPDLAKIFEELIQRLDRDPVTVEVQLSSGERVKGIFNGARMAEFILMASAQTNMIPWLPGFIYDVGGGNMNRLQDLAGALHPHEGFSWGLGLSVLCSESVAYTEDDILLAEALPAYERAVVDASWGPRSWIQSCPVWGVDPITPESLRPVTSEVPTLVLTGQFDGITPPAWAHEVAQGLSNSFVYEIPGYGHSATFGGICPTTIALQFLEDPTTAPDASCTEQMEIEYQLD